MKKVILMNKNEALRIVEKDAFELKNLPGHFKKDKEIVLKAVKEKTAALEYADKTLKKDGKFILEAMKQCYSEVVVKYVDKSLSKDKKFILKAVKQRGLALEFADKSLKKDKEIVLAAVKQDGIALTDADKSLKKDQEIVIAAIKQSTFAIEFADKILKKNKKFILELMKQKIMYYYDTANFVDKSLKKDRKFILKAVKLRGSTLEFADKIFKKDKEIVLAAVKQDGIALEYADASLKKDKEIVLAAVKQHKFEFMPEGLKKDPDILAILNKKKVNQSMVDSANKPLAKHNPPSELPTKLPDRFTDEGMKRIKFKNNTFGEKKFYQIVFEQKKTSTIWGGIRSSIRNDMYYPEPQNWSYKEIKFDGHEAISYYNKKLKNKKRNTKGLEIILQVQAYLDEIVSFYRGGWKNDKKNGKGFWSNYHPLIGECTTAGIDDASYIVELDIYEECSFDGTFKNDEFDKGIFTNNEGIFKGSFKAGKMFNGTLTYWLNKDYQQKLSDKKIEIIKGKSLKKRPNE